MTLDRFARNELRLAALGKIPKKTRDLWSLGALLDAEGDAPESLTWAADYAAGGENPKLALLGEEGLTPLMLPELTGMPITRMDAGQTLAGAKHTMVQKLLRRRELRGLRALDLCGAPVKAAAAELSGCDRLESLGLGATALVVEGLTRASLPALKGLELRGNKLCAKDLLALLQATGLPLLEELDAGANLVTDDGFDALVGSGALGRLRALGLDTGPATRISPEGWATFAASPDVEGLQKLSVGRGGAANALGALLTAERLRGLRSLAVGLATPPCRAASVGILRGQPPRPGVHRCPAGLPGADGLTYTGSLAGVVRSCGIAGALPVPVVQWATVAHPTLQRLSCRRGRQRRTGYSSSPGAAVARAALPRAHHRPCKAAVGGSPDLATHRQTGARWCRSARPEWPAFRAQGAEHRDRPYGRKRVCRLGLVAEGGVAAGPCLGLRCGGSSGTAGTAPRGELHAAGGALDADHCRGR